MAVDTVAATRQAIIAEFAERLLKYRGLAVEPLMRLANLLLILPPLQVR